MTGELIALIAKMALAQLDPSSSPERRPAPKAKFQLPPEKPSEPLQASRSPKLQTSSSLKRHIPQPLRREVFRRDQNQCTNCGSDFAIQVDHSQIPFAQGGQNTLENLRVLCRSCNRRHAIETYGLEKMERETQKGYDRNLAKSSPTH